MQYKDDRLEEMSVMMINGSKIAAPKIEITLQKAGLE